MVQAMGIAMVLLGAILFHIAAGGKKLNNVGDIWKDILDTISEVRK